MSAKDYAGALANPFDGPVSGIIDEFGGKTVAFRVNQTQLLGTPLGHGYTGCIVKTTAISTSFLGLVSAAGTDGSSLTVGTNVPLEGASDLALHYDQYRPVSMGVKVYYTGQESTTAGTVSVAVINGASTIADFPLDFDEWFNLPDSHTVACASMTDPIVAICHSFDRPRFGPWNTTNTESFFPAIGVWSAGLPVNTPGVLRLEISIILEAIPKYGSVLTQHQAREVPWDPSGMAMAHRKLPVARTGGQELTVARHIAVAAGGVAKRRKKIAARRGIATGHASRRPLHMKAMGRRSKPTYRKKKRKMLFRRR